MAYKSVNVEITQEHFDRSIKGSPKEAVKELIWNACDADAKNIEVSFDYDGIAGAESVSDIYVKDDGHGIAIDHIEEYFGKYGRSQKTYSDYELGKYKIPTSMVINIAKFHNISLEDLLSKQC